MEWFEELDFYENPFSTDPVKSAKKLVGADALLNELFYRVEAGSIMFIEGEDGLGKTSLLKQVIRRFKGKKKVIYFDCSEIDTKADIEALMQGRYGFFGKLLKIAPKGMIVLLDSASLSPGNIEKVKFYFDEGYIKSLVLTGRSYAAAKLPRSVRERIGSRVIRLSPLSDEQAVAVVRSRIGDTLFTDEMIKKIYKQSGKNTKLLLGNCEKVAKKVVQEKRKVAEGSDLKVIGDKNG